MGLASLAPRLGLALAGLLAQVVPPARLAQLGRGAAPLMLGTLPGLRADLLANARRLLPDASPPARERLAREVIASFARFVCELAGPELPADEAMFERMRGREHFDRAAALGKGVIGVSLHMGHYEVGPQLLARRLQPLLVLYESDPSGVFEWLRNRRRAGSGVRGIAIDRSPWFGVEALSALRAGGMVLVAGDLGHGRARGVEADFLGGRAGFADWPLRLARSSGAPLLPCFIVRERGRYELLIEPPIIPRECEAPEELLTRLVPVFEAMVRRYPEQWLIIHRYWRS